MALRITNLRMSVEQPESELPVRIARRLKVPQTELLRWRILRKSPDRIPDPVVENEFIIGASTGR